MRDEGIDTVRCVADEKYMSPRPVSSACTVASVRRVTSSMSSGTLEIGAGEGIRTLDPDLGKVVLKLPAKIVEIKSQRRLGGNEARSAP